VRGLVAFSKDASAEFVRFSEANGFNPVVSQIFEFDQAIQAFEAMEKQNSVGKLIVKIDEE
jgi:D-arabinose 1-dehydrogenase-like Zn-dependent alcohol dehydrogenase